MRALSEYFSDNLKDMCLPVSGAGLFRSFVSLVSEQRIICQEISRNSRRNCDRLSRLVLFPSDHLQSSSNLLNAEAEDPFIG